MKLSVSKVYSGEELEELLEVSEENRRHEAVIGKKAIAIVEDMGNDNWKIIDIYKLEGRESVR